MDKKQAKLMLKLADYLDKFKEPPAGSGGVGFDMTNLYSEMPVHVKLWGHRNHPCGSAACALGHAGMMPCFNKIGLRTDKEERRVIFEPEDGGRYEGFDAGEAVFGITTEETYDLFDSIRRTAKQEAKVLLKFVRSKLPDLVK